jgi:choline dehydrogenase
MQKKIYQLTIAYMAFASLIIKPCCTPINSASVDVAVSADYVIIGLGTAGATLARYLSDNFNNSVVVLEAGSNYSDVEEIASANPINFGPIADNPKYSKTFSVISPNVNFGSNGYVYTDGRMWGGGSGHNNLQAVRSSFDIYDLWAAASGNNRWLYANLLPIMKGMEHYTVATGSLPPDTTQRGIAGSLFISQEPYDPTISSNPLAIAFATAAGAPLSQDYNIQSATVATSANQQFATPPAGDVAVSMRSFSISAFLPETVVNWDTGIGLNGRRLHIVSQATASHILFSGTTAVGVEYILEGNRENVRQIYARKKIILCAGSIPNVGILQRSGIGPSALLTSLGIPVVVDSPRVGENLQNHCGTTTIMQVDVDAPGPDGLTQAFIDCSTAVGIGANFSAGVRRNQLEFSAGTNFFGSNSVLRALGLANDDPSTFASFLTFNVRPQSRGTAAIVDTDPLTDVSVNFNFYSDGDVTDAGSDAQNVVAALRIIEQTATAAGATMVYPTPAQYIAGDEELFEAAKNLPVLAYHAAGTCAMGTSIANGVVDGNLNVFGVTNLMCADCSVESQITTGNTAYGAFVIGLEAARILGATVPTI